MGGTGWYLSELLRKTALAVLGDQDGARAFTIIGYILSSTRPRRDGTVVVLDVTGRNAFSTKCVCGEIVFAVWKVEDCADPTISRIKWTAKAVDALCDRHVASEEEGIMIPLQVMT